VSRGNSGRAEHEDERKSRGTGPDQSTKTYQVNLGMPWPTFFAFVPMRTLAQNDDLLNLPDLLHQAEGEGTERMQQIARAGYGRTESNLYAISPEKSPVPKEFAAGDPEFWTPKPPAPMGVAAKRKELADTASLEKWHHSPFLANS
jgi:hypothetical protein